MPSEWSERRFCGCLPACDLLSYLFSLSPTSFSTLFLHRLHSLTQLPSMSSNHFWRPVNDEPTSHKTKILTGSKLFRQILDNMIATEQALEGTTMSGLQLRDYQTDGIQAVLKALDDGLGCIGVSAPTGSGKTTMFTMLIPLIPLRGNANMVLIIVHNITLAKQVYANTFLASIQSVSNKGLEFPTDSIICELDFSHGMCNHTDPAVSLPPGKPCSTC